MFDRILYIPPNILESLRLFDEEFQSSGQNSDGLYVVPIPDGWEVVIVPDRGLIPGLPSKMSLTLPFENSMIVGEFITLTGKSERLQIHYQLLDGRKTNWMFEVLPVEPE